MILLGDSAVGKSKLVERFLLDGYAPQQLSTYALTLYRWDIKRSYEIKMYATRYRTKVGTRDVLIDFWDTAGQERFNTMHRSYYHQAHACIMVFDATRKVMDWLLNIIQSGVYETLPDLKHDCIFHCNFSVR